MLKHLCCANVIWNVLNDVPSGSIVSVSETGDCAFASVLGDILGLMNVQYDGCALFPFSTLVVE